MAKKTVLAIGIEPGFVDFSAFPGLSIELVRNYIEAQIEQLRALGFDVESCLIDLGETAEAVATQALTSRRLDCVVIISQEQRYFHLPTSSLPKEHFIVARRLPKKPLVIHHFHPVVGNLRFKPQGNL